MPRRNHPKKHVSKKRGKQKETYREDDFDY